MYTCIYIYTVPLCCVFSISAHVKHVEREGVGSERNTRERVRKGEREENKRAMRVYESSDKSCGWLGG